MPTIDVTDEEAQVLLKLMQLGLNKVKGQHFVTLRFGGRMDTGTLIPVAQRVVAIVNAQVALSK